MRRAYAVVVRRVARNFSADCPDLLGCVATGRTLDETEVLLGGPTQWRGRVRGGGMRHHAASVPPAARPGNTWNRTRH